MNKKSDEFERLIYRINSLQEALRDAFSVCYDEAKDSYYLNTLMEVISSEIKNLVSLFDECNTK